MVRGILLGKFLPPHQGHVELFNFARRYVDELLILISLEPEDGIGGQARLDWVSQLCPQCKVQLVTKSLHEDSAEDWAGYIKDTLETPVDYLFAMEKLGLSLAQKLSAHRVTTEPSLSSLELESQAIRQNASAHWDRLPPIVRPHYLKRVCVFGPESTGKSTLCHRLAQHFRTLAVPEYARTYLEGKDAPYELSDVVPVARGQRASEQALSLRAHRVLFCDTDMLTTKIWSEWLFQQCDPWILETIKEEHYDLHLLTSADVPWVDDAVRYLPNDRENFEAKCEEELKAHGRSYVKISGSWEHRFETAVQAVEELLK